MKLLACHIENFGKLSDFRMNFHDGVNIINQENGWGKSTLAAFLKAMLYGFDNKKEPGEFEKERRKYTPWQGGTFGGELDIEVDGRKYRICRYFGTTEKTDRFRLYDLETNLESHDFSANIGIELFDLDRASFRRTIFIAQNDCQTGSSDSINAKLGNLAQASDDINNYEKALTSIRARLNHLSPKRATGSLRRRRDLITQLEQELKGLDAADQSAVSVRNRLQEKQQQYKEMLQIRAEYAKALITASEDSRRKQLAEDYHILEQELAEQADILRTYIESFPQDIPTEEDFAECREVIRQLEAQNVTVHHMSINAEEWNESETLRGLFAGGVPRQEVLDGMIGLAAGISTDRRKALELEGKINRLESDYVQESRNSYVSAAAAKSALVPVGIVILGFGALFTVLQFVLQNQGILQTTGQKLALIFGITLIITGLVLSYLGKRNNDMNRLQIAHQLEERDRMLASMAEPIDRARESLAQLKEKIAADTEEAEQFLEDYSFVDKALPLQEQIYDVKARANRLLGLLEREAGLFAAVQDKKQLTVRLNQLAVKMGVVYDENLSGVLNSLQSKIAEYFLLKEGYAKSLEKKSRFEKEHDIATILSPQECPFALEELQNMILEADESIEQLRAIIDRYEHQLEDLQQQMDQRDEKEQELAIAKNAQEKEAREYEILELTQHYLKHSKEKFIARYMGPITRAFAKYYEIMTGESSDEWLIDANLGLKLRQKGILRETYWLSAGYQDLLGVCLRLALVEAMFPGEKPFLVFDDPFVNLDDAKLENGKRLLKGLSKEYQSIYFTCHESRQLEETAL